MEEVIQTGQHGVVDGILAVNTTVVLHVGAQATHYGVLPEIQATGNLHVGSVRGEESSVDAVVEVMIDKEEGVAPIVIVETFYSSGYVLTVFTEVVKHLDVGLGLGHSEGRKSDAQGKNSFFHKT